MPAFGPIEAAKLYAIMAAGGLFAVAGLALLFRPPQGDSVQVVEVLGVKIRVSSAGTVVFLVGAAFLLAPVFVKEDQGPIPTSIDGPTPVPVISSLPPPVKGSEVEPNNDFSQPNQIEIGETYKGTLTGKDEDFFVFSTKARAGQVMRFILHTSGNAVSATLFDVGEQPDDLGTSFGDLSQAFRLGELDFYTIRLRIYVGSRSSDAFATYELRVQPAS